MVCPKFNSSYQLHLTFQLVENTAIHLVPVMNPDGMAKVKDLGCNSRDGLTNANGVDLHHGFSGLFQSLTLDG